MTDANVLEYTYNSDKLIKVGEEKIEYAETELLGNPSNYRGHSLDWNTLRNLAKYDTIEFTYNANGIRTKKVNGNNESKYYYLDSRLLSEKRDIHSSDLSLNDYLYEGEIYYTYTDKTDISYMYNANELTSFTITKQGQNETYYYRKNLQGDITHIYDSLGNLKTEYVYDAWGNHKVYAIENGNTLDITNDLTYTNVGHINPFRYRGYYYDTETGLYYLQSRYYDPQTGRFINADAISILDESKDLINGLNLYVYCNNNPVMLTDSTGYFALIKPNFILNFKQLEKIFKFSKMVKRVSNTHSVIDDPVLAALLGNLSYSLTIQFEDTKGAYVYSDIGNGYVGYGVGINLGNVLGLEVGLTAGNFWDLGLNASVSVGNISISGSLGTSGVGATFGVTINNATHTIGGTIGWGTIAFATAMALSPIPGGRLIAVFTLLFDWLF